MLKKGEQNKFDLTRIMLCISHIVTRYHRASPGLLILLSLFFMNFNEDGHFSTITVIYTIKSCS